MLSDKYIAGFLDADGSIQIAWRNVDRENSNPDLKRAYLSLEFSQKADQSRVLDLISKRIGGVVAIDFRGYSLLKVFGSQAEQVLSRICKHLVIKRHYAKVCLEIHGKVCNRREMAARLTEERRQPSLPLPNFPSRQWLAGYIDGDGSFVGYANRKDTTVAVVQCQIVASEYDAEGLDIIRKNFGGTMSRVTKMPHLFVWKLGLEPSKAKKFLGYFSKHLVTKRDQAMFILGCAEMGHYRDGKSISRILKQLKAHPHRLSDPEINVQELLHEVDFSIETRRIRSKRLWDEKGGCSGCGSRAVAHYCDGLCRACYDRKRWSKRQSA
jgi:hypothetical protein